MKRELSLPCRYKVVLDSKRNSYTFTTDSKAEYEILFTLDNGIFQGTELENGEIYQIVINKIKDGSGGKDDEIKLTVYAVIEHFFSNTNRILIYSCDTGDKRHYARMRMFNIWYTKSDLRSEIKKIDEKIESDDLLYFTSLIYHSDNEITESNIVKTFKEIVEILRDAK